MVMPRPGRRDQARAWVLLAFGLLMIIPGMAFAIHKFTIVDLAPIAVGIAAALVGLRVLRRKRIF